jgi:lipoprotein-anchoring transpeptidase ErfK/SrfK
MAYQPVSRRVKRGASTIALATLLLLLLSLALSACGGSSQSQQQATASKATLDQLLAHAQSIGVPVTLLQPIQQQEVQISNTSAPLGLFSDQSTNDYYNNLTQRYHALSIQVKGLEYQTTQQLDYQTSLDLQSFEKSLAVRQAQGFIEAKTFASQLTQDQQALAKAQYPKDYVQISNNAKLSTQALQLMGPTYNDLTTFQQDIKQLQASHLDTTALNQQYQQDLQQFRVATQPQDFSTLMTQLNAQLQETMVYSTQAIPYVGAAKLQQFSSEIQQLKTYGQSTTSFQQKLNNDQQALNAAQSINDYLKVSAQIDRDIASLQYSLIVGQANYLLKQFHSAVTAWGNTHQYHDSYDGNTYNLDYEYDEQGIGLDADSAVQYAQSTGAVSDYQAAIDLIQNDMVNLQAMEADYSDKTSWNQPHNTDIQLMKHYGVYGPNSGQVLVVSLVEQVLRYYNNGKLVRSFHIVSGQYEKPSPPGFWSIFLKQSPTIFKSSEPKGSAFWYPDTNIKYAMEYHDGGYFFHDAWWRCTFGSGTNFPHADACGTTDFNGNGSHGCINMASDDIAWLYPQISWGASVILY